MEIKNTTTIIIIMALVIAGGVGVYAYNEITERAYNLGVQDAVQLVNQQMINSLVEQGFIPYIFPINATDSINIKLIPQLYEQNGDR